ncbi:unnamed protein product [Paramecium pentaurelia]|uniref:Uncharacterized protein n=1 Tax=Paramecium pentaurelia TaxID=43138 RepID=A0A8S1VRZ2_9CILI|nr:unnamed protein product [Paramecium pentaurelia]
MQDLRCSIADHNKKKFVSITLQKEAEKRLFCFQCQSDASGGDITKSQLVSKLKLCDLDEVMEGNAYSVYNWPADDEGIKVKDFLLGYKSVDQQRKDVEDFFVQMKQKLNEQIENVKQLLVEALNATQFIKDEKLKQEEPEKKDVKKDDKKETKKDDKKETKKDDKKDTKKDDKKDEKKDLKKEEEKLDLSPTIENLKKHYDIIYDLTKIKTLIKENAKSDPNLLSAKINEYLNDQKRSEQIINMKKVFQGVMSGKVGFNQIASNRQALESYWEQIQTSIQQWPYKFGRLQWKLNPSKADESKQIKQLADDYMECAGAGLQSQIIYSEKSFSEGQHGCIILFKEFDQKRGGANGNFYVGVVPEEQKDKSPYGQGFRKDLFSQNGEGLNVRIGTDFNNVFKMPPKLLAVKLDVDSNYFEICDGKRTVVYGLDQDSKLKGQKWRIYFWWNIAADRIQLIHSY